LEDSLRGAAAEASSPTAGLARLMQQTK